MANPVKAQTLDRPAAGKSRISGDGAGNLVTAAPVPLDGAGVVSYERSSRNEQELPQLRGPLPAVRTRSPVSLRTRPSSKQEQIVQPLPVSLSQDRIAKFSAPGQQGESISRAI